ncbi:MAG: Rhomboid-like protein [Aureobasidium pullulans]|nr:MAG: Rhomboid-like protein [Aureobasidium pullulans]
MPTYAVLGATGNTGQSLLQILTQDPSNTVHAYCRSKSKLERLQPNITNNPNVKVYEGSLTDTEVIRDCIKNTHAVFLAVAVSGNVPGNTIAQDTARVVVAALKQIHETDASSKLPRLVVLSAVPTEPAFSKDMPALALTILFRAESNIYNDLIAAEKQLRKEQDWLSVTFVKPGALSIDSQKGHALTMEGPKGVVSFLDLAAAKVISAVTIPHTALNLVTTHSPPIAMSTALVTGGTGFIGIYVIKLLLERGDRVHTTVRDLKDQKKCQPLLSLQNAYPGKLHLFQADLLKEGSFAQAMQGCDIVHHVASPFLVPQQIKDGMKDIVEPAIKGTQNVLNTANQTESVKRIVLTSSIAAMYGDSADVLHYDNATLTESHWNTTSTATSSAYSYSKVAAEREAWKICHAQSRWDLIAINPGLVIGPSLTPESASGSLHMLEAMYKGDNKMGAPELHYPIADEGTSLPARGV